MAEVIHRYVRDPSAGPKYRASEELAAERTAHERTKRLEREMAIAQRRGELIEKKEAIAQAAALMVNFRQRALLCPAQVARKLLQRGMIAPDQRITVTELLKSEICGLLTELAGLPDAVSNGDEIDAARAKAEWRKAKKAASRKV